MATRRDAPAPRRQPVPKWVRCYVEPDWLAHVPPQPDGAEWIAPERWQDMKARAAWSAARRAWLIEHGIEYKLWRTPEYQTKPVVVRD